ncbi:MAG: SCO family protein [Myxococcales bacterium]|nr:SCO family protein [Myxococcales bacterium]MCB9583042.1 SCO family protein [Polyangiaceae bacterium]
MHARIPTLLAASLAALLIAVISMPARAEGAAEPRVTRTEPLPKRLDGVRVDEHLGDSIPLDLGFVDEEGKPVTLRDYFDGKVPVIITLNYSDCPMLCSLQLSGVVDSMKQVDWSAGKEYRLVTVSINPKEGPERARKTKARYLQQYGRPGAEDGWHFLTGSANNVHALANAIGFRYSYNEKRDEWVHPAAITVTAPNGKIARYLYGIEYHPKTLRLSLVEASEGKIGTTIDKLVLYCFHYDATEGRYAPVARNIMRLGGAIAVVVLGGFLSLLWAREAKKKRLSLQGSHT